MRKLICNWKKLGGYDYQIREVGPKPFPGRYPTRWELAIAHKRPEDKTFRWFKYAGKPSTKQAVIAMNLLHNAAWSGLYFREYDRGGTLSHVITSARSGDLPSTSASAHYAYYPGLTERPSWWHWVSKKFDTVFVKFGGRKYSMYVAHGTEESVLIANLEESKKWLLKTFAS